MANPFVKAWKYMMALFSSKVDEYADPKVQIQQAIEEAQRQHQALSQQAAAVIGNQRQLEMKLNRQLGEIEKTQASARQALILADQARANGDEASAQRYEETAQVYATQLVTAEQSVEDLKTLHDQSIQAAEQGKELPALAREVLAARQARQEPASAASLADAAPVRMVRLGDIAFEVVPVKLVIGLLLLALTAMELVPRLRGLAFPPRWLPLGGLLSGFFGGLSGLQGALRSAFLARAGLDARVFIGTGVVVAALVDLSRLGVYAGALRNAGPSIDLPLLATAVAAAFAGALLGRRYLAKATMPGATTIT